MGLLYTVYTQGRVSARIINIVPVTAALQVSVYPKATLLDPCSQLSCASTFACKRAFQVLLIILIYPKITIYLRVFSEPTLFPLNTYASSTTLFAEVFLLVEADFCRKYGTIFKLNRILQSFHIRSRLLFTMNIFFTYRLHKFH